MNVYITKVNGLPLQNHLQAIQWMNVEIAHELNCREMGIFCYDGSSESTESLRSRIDGIIAGTTWRKDIIICQFPTGNGFKFECELVKRLKLYGGRIVIFNYNSEEFIHERNQAILAETIRLYDHAEVLIVPSMAMCQFFLDKGIRKDMKFVIQGMWDYTIGMDFLNSPQFRKEIHYIGDGKLDELDNWNYAVPLKLYATSAVRGKYVKRMEELSQGELISQLSKGGFGLVWYQNSELYHEMEYGLSYDLSKYLAAGIPIIVPAGISNQTLIEKNRLGLIVNSLDEAARVVESMTEWEYQSYVQHVKRFADSLRNGYNMRRCLVDTVHAVCRTDVGKNFTPTSIYDPGEKEFTYIILKESYGGNLALSWCYQGKTEGFLIYDIFGKLLHETRNIHKHYFKIKGYGTESGFIVKSFVDTPNGKLCIAESKPVYLHIEQSEDYKVSMIMPAYNAEEYIARSIDTALAQSFAGLELIIVDDGSTDHTEDIVDWYAEKYSNVVAIHQKNGGVPAARNTGIRRASGDYIGFMDNDDMLHPNMIARLYNAIKTNDCDIAVTSIFQIRNDGYEVSVQYPMEENTAISIDDFFNMHFEKGLWFAVMVWNRLYRSSLVKTHLFPILVGDDDAWSPYVLSYADRICYLDDRSYEYDRIIRNSTLLDRWKNSSKEERFMTYKKIIIFFMENGNPRRRGALKKLAREELLGLAKSYAYDAYEKLWRQIEETF